MTPEERFTKIEEAMLVNSSLIVRVEQNMDRLTQRVDQLTATVERLAQTQADGFAELRATQVALMKMFDRLIRGQEGNGRKQ